MSTSEQKPVEPTQPWYAEGLSFQCTGCGDCCTGAPGYVWVNRAECQAIADELGIGLTEFEARFTHEVGIRRSLNERANYDCVFLDGTTRKCTVYASRPRQCRTWPFWDSNLRTPRTWAETCEVCPGSGKGQLYQLQHIEQQRAIVRV